MKAITALLFWCFLVTIASAQTLTYQNTLPGTKYPIAVTMPEATWGHETIIASVNGDVMANGGTIIASIGSWNLEAGNFTVGINSKGSNGLHIYKVGGLQTSGSAPLVPHKKYTIAATINGTNLSLYVCSPRCIKTYTADKTPLKPGGAGYIGGAGSGVRTCSKCHIWGVYILTPLTNDQVQAIALVAPDDPYAPSPTPTASPTPFSSPTASPTASPSASPTASPTAVPTTGGAWPAAGWVPYPNSPLTVRVAPNPTYTSSSAAIINAMWSNDSTDPGRLQVDSGPPPPNTQDYSQPLYFGHASDPVYTVSCYDYGGACPPSGAKVHIPKGAYPAGGTDHHLSVRDLVTGNDVMLWLVPNLSGNGGALSVGWGTLIPSNGNGLNAIGGTASGMSALWQLREADLAHNTINHAIIVQINGESQDGFVYPATGWDNGYFHADPWPRMGAHFWLDVAPPYASSCPQYAVSYLTALNKYGAYMAENGAISGSMQAIYESDMSYTYNGGASVWGPLMQSLGGSLVGMSNVAMSSCGINLQTHMHVLNP